MNEWTETQWRSRTDRLPKMTDGLPLSEGGKVLVFVLSKRIIAAGDEPEVRGFHVSASAFDDDEGMDTVMFWAPCWDKQVKACYEESHTLPPETKK